jgi:PAS domain S-box-containing protein
MKTPDDLYFLKGDSEMHRLTREKNWSDTVVGHPQMWPQSLKTTLGIILNSKFPMFLWWGPELICYYNDAYRPSLGQKGKHPTILGIPARDAWEEIWDVIFPLISQVMEGGESTWSEDQYIPIYRNGRMEDVYWTFSYSPVYDENSQVAGVLVTCTETTEKVNTLRRVEENKLRFQNHILQAPVAMCIFTGENYVVELANQKMLELWGKTEEEVLNRPIFKGLPEAKGQGLEILLEEVYTSGIKFEAREMPVNLPRNGRIETVYLNFIYEARTEPDGKITGVVAIASDVTDMVNSRLKLEKSEQRVREIVQNTPFPMGVFMGKDFRIGIANQAILKTWGKGNDVIGKTFREILPELDPLIFEQAEKVYNTSIPFFAENARVDLMIDDKLETFYFNYNFIPLLDEEGKVYGVMNTAADVTDLTRTKNQISESEERFRNMAESSDILIATGDEVGNATYFNQAWTKLTGRPTQDLLSFGWADLVHPDDRDGFLDIYLGAFETQSKWSGEFRILNKDAQYNRLYAKGSPRYTADGVFEGYIGSCVDITEQKKAEEGLKKSEQRFRNLIMLSPVGIALFKGPEHRIEMVNEVMLKRWKKSERDLLGKKLIEGFPEIKMEKFILSLDEVYRTKKAVRSFDSLVEVIESGELKTYYFDFEYTPLIDINGDINSIIATTVEVTEKVLARKKIEESEQRFRHVADSAPAMIWMSSADKQCIFLNKAWLEFTGRPMQEQLGEGWVEGIHPEDYHYAFQVYSDAFDRREEFYMEFRLKRRDGIYRWVSDTGKPRLTSNNEFEGFIGACLDIHDQITYQKKLEEDEARLNIVIEASELGTWELNLKSREVHYSDRYLQILGYNPPVELTHEQILKHLHPDDFTVRDKAFIQAFETGFLHYVSRIIWNDGSIHWVEGKGRVFFDEQNDPVKMIGTVQDITDEKKSQKELLESEQKFRLLADSMPQHIWTADTQGNLNYFNQSVFTYSGLSPNQLMQDGWMQIVHPEDRAENIKLWKEAVEKGHDFLFEHRFRKHDGEYRWQLSRAIPQRDANGVIQMWVGTSTDIQDQREFLSELEKQVQQRTTELKEKNKELENMNTELQSFAYISSHDLQEPLRKIQTFTSRIMEKEHSNLSENGKDNFRRMQAAARRMQTLIEDLLAYSRSSNSEHKYESTDLDKIVSEVLDDMREELQQKQAKVEVSIDCQLKMIPFQFRQLLINLIGNSLKFSKPDVPSRISIKSTVAAAEKFNVSKLEKDLEYCHIRVSDNGIGFEPHYNEKIFGVFQRLHGKSQYAGTGIGLAIVKKIVENHGGVITAKSELGEGATFDIYIPVV